MLVERRGVIQFLMKPKILSWILKGLNEGDKWLRVRNLLRDWKVDVVCFQETKLEVTSCSVVCSFVGFPSEMLKIILLGFLQVSLALMLIGIEG